MKTRLSDHSHRGLTVTHQESRRAAVPVMLCERKIVQKQEGDHVKNP